MIPFFNIMPVDKTTIKTKFCIHPDLFDNPESFIRTHNLPIRTMTPIPGFRAGRRTWNLTLEVLTYKGIKVKLVKFDGNPLADATIEFNPGVCLYGHNGRILTLSEFLDALAVLVTHLAPLLSDPNNFVNIVPGLIQGGPAYWSYLEVPFHCNDPDGELLVRLRHLRHPRITTSSRHWPTSIQVGGPRGKLRFSIYSKAIEMVERGKLSKSNLPDYSGILRMEARMREEKLVHYYGNSRNVEVIEGKDRLVRFYPHDLISGHRMSFGEMQGVYSRDEGTDEPGESTPLVAMGRLLAQVAVNPCTTHTFRDLLSHVEFYTGAGASTISEIRKAGLAELSRMSHISRDALFSDAAYEAQLGIASEEPEEKVCHELSPLIHHPLITAAYQPPGQPLDPHTKWPSYIRI